VAIGGDIDLKVRKAGPDPVDGDQGYGKPEQQAR
jgi:hypothetical protein